MGRSSALLLLCWLAAPVARAGELWPARALAPDPAALRGAPAGDQLHPRMVQLPSGRLFAVFTDTRGSPAWPTVWGAVVDPANPRAAAPFRVAPSNLLQTDPDVACGAQACFVVWTEQGAWYEGAVRLQPFSLEGAPLGASKILSAPSSSVRSTPAVAFLADGSQALVVWSENETILYSRLDSAGAVLQGPSALSSTPQVSNYRPRAAGTSSTFVVVWTHEGQGGYQLRSNTVSPVDGAPGTMLLLNINPEGSQVPNLISAGGRVLLATFQLQGTSFGSVLAWPLGQDGAPEKLTPLLVGAGKGHYGRPDAVFDGTDWVVLSAEERDGEHLRADRVDAACTAASFVGQLAPEGRTAYAAGGAVATVAPAVSPTPWVVWMDDRSRLDADLYLAKAELGGFKLSPPDAGLRLFDSAPAQEEPLVAPAETGFLVAWRESSAPGTRQLKAALVGQDGAPAEAPRVLFSGSHGVHAPALARARDGYGLEGFALGWLESYTNHTVLKIARLDSRGVPIDGTEREFWDSDSAYPSAPLALFTRTGTWVLSASSPRGADRLLYGIRTTRNSGWEGAPRALLAAKGLDSFAGASAAARFYVAWRGEGVFGTRFALDGSPLNDHLAGRLSESKYAGDPAVGSDGANFLVVWSEGEGGSENLKGVVVRGEDGRPTSAPRVYLDPAATELMWRGEMLRPRVAWDGERYLVTVNVAGRDGGFDVHLLAIDKAGEVLERGVVAEGPEHELEGTVGSDSYGRSLVAYSAYLPDAGARRLHARAAAALALGYSCLASTECNQGVCDPALGCCSVDGSPCVDPRAIPAELTVACGCGAAPRSATALGLALAALASRRRRGSRAR